LFLDFSPDRSPKETIETLVIQSNLIRVKNTSSGLFYLVLITMENVKTFIGRDHLEEVAQENAFKLAFDYLKFAVQNESHSEAPLKSSKKTLLKHTLSLPTSGFDSEGAFSACKYYF